MPAADISLLRLATRGSALARAQAALAAQALRAPGGVDIETVIVRTEGDRRIDVGHARDTRVDEMNRLAP